jgi:hypothetical protein
MIGVMKTRLLAAAVALTFVATVSVAAPATATEAVPATATEAALATATEAAPLASVVTCHWSDAEYPHISSFNLRRNGMIDIKTSAQGSCESSTDPLFVTADMTLEKQNFFGFWSTVATGASITKSIQGNPQIWRRGELFAVTPCVPGTYRGTLSRSVQAEGGIAVILGEEIVSPPKVIDCKPRQVSMVIDDTGSMGGVIGSVSSSLSSFIQSSPEDEYTRWSLTTFKDSPTTVGTTEDRDQALSWVDGLSASGGDDCPEEALGGISSGLSALGTDPDTDKQMIVATDASAHGGDVDGIIAAAQASGTHVNVLLTGDCGYPSAAAVMAATTTAYPYEVSSQVVLRRIANETGGKYFFIPGGSTSDFTAALNDIFASIANPGEDTQPPTVTLSGVPTVIWSPNHKMVEVTPTVTATDNEDPNPVVKLVGVEVSQPDDGQGDGNTSGDVQVTADGRIFVRAERSATEGARTYTITYRATDRSGNNGFGSATVVVPRSKSGK